MDQPGFKDEPEGWRESAWVLGEQGGGTPSGDAGVFRLRALVLLWWLPESDDDRAELLHGLAAGLRSRLTAAVASKVAWTRP